MMNSKLISLAAVALLFTGSRAALAQIPANLKNPDIIIDYVKPTNEFFLPVHQRMMKRQVLEKLRSFLAPMKLPHKLTLRLRQCNRDDAGGELNAWYSPGEVSITYCYNYIELAERYAPSVVTDEGLTPQDAVDGEFVGTILHELGHAAVDLYHLPVFGREEDVADQVSGFIMLQFGPNVARRTILAKAHFYRESANNRGWNLYWDVHGTDLQRYYNYLCLGYGGFPDAFKDLIAKKLLPERRARNCKREFELVRKAFVQTIFPHLDVKLVKEVQSIDWLKQ